MVIEYTAAWLLPVGSERRSWVLALGVGCNEGVKRRVGCHPKFGVYLGSVQRMDELAGE